MRLSALCLLALVLVSARIASPAAQLVCDDNNQLVKVIYSAQREVSYSCDTAGTALEVAMDLGQDVPGVEDVLAEPGGTPQIMSQVPKATRFCKE